MLVSCVDAPAATASAVLLSDDDTGNPPTNPAAEFAPASARSSWSASIRSPVRRANARPVSTLPLNATTVTPVAAANTPGHECAGMCGSASDGRPLGMVPTVATPRLSRSNAAVTAVAPRTTSSGPGTRGNRCSANSAPMTAAPTRSGASSTFSIPHANVDRTINRVRTVCRDSTEIRELRNDHDDRDACEVTDENGSRQEVGEKPEPNNPRHERQHTHRDGERGGRRRGIQVGRAGQRRDRGPHEQRGSTLGPDRQHPTRPQQRVQHQGGQRRPQTCHRVESGQSRIGEALRHEIGRHRDARHAVASTGPSPRTERGQPRGFRECGHEPPSCGHGSMMRFRSEIGDTSGDLRLLVPGCGIGLTDWSDSAARHRGSNAARSVRRVVAM